MSHALSVSLPCYTNHYQRHLDTLRDTQIQRYLSYAHRKTKKQKSRFVRFDSNKRESCLGTSLVSVTVAQMKRQPAAPTLSLQTEISRRPSRIYRLSWDTSLRNALAKLLWHVVNASEKASLASIHGAAHSQQGLVDRLCAISLFSLVALCIFLCRLLMLLLHHA